LRAPWQRLVTVKIREEDVVGWKSLAERTEAGRQKDRAQHASVSIAHAKL
jgi:hypothetical protein